MKTLTQLTMAGALGVALLANSVSAQAPPDGKRPGGNRPDGQPPGGGPQGGQRGGPGGGPGGLDRVIQELNLTDAQLGKVEAIRQAQQEKMKAVNDEFMAKLKGVLNEEQFKKVSEAQQRPPGRQGGFGGPGGQGGGPGSPGGQGGQRGGFNPLEQIAKDLNLTAEQQTKFDAVRQVQQEKMRGMFQKMQSGELDREGMMAEGAKLREGLLKDLKGILNAEQYAKVEEAMKRGPQGGGPPGGFQQPGGGQRPEGKKRPE